MKAVLISIQPKWCELIASSKKTIEVRKTKPKLETPFKVYIYCTNSKPILGRCLKDGSLKETPEDDFDNYNRDTLFMANGKVIGEFVCEWIDTIECDSGSHLFYSLNGSCLTQNDFLNYCNGQELYAWHISDLVIYDKPRELSEFYNHCYSGCDNCEYQSWDYSYAGGKDLICTCRNKKPLKKPPQSWRYVERLVDG